MWHPGSRLSAGVREFGAKNVKTGRIQEDMGAHASFEKIARLFGYTRILITYFTLWTLASGCSGITPTIERPTPENRGKLIVGCSNVSRSDDSREFVTDYYLTTWMSAPRAGAAQGLYEGLEEAPLDMTPEERKQSIFGRLPPSDIYCRRFAAHPNVVFSIAETMLQEYGYDWEYKNPDDGLLWSGFVHRAAPAFGKTVICDDDCDGINPNRKWRDKYRIDIKPNNLGGSDVRVHREIRISRPMDGGWSDYQLNQSVGYNEAVILNQIETELRLRDGK